MNDKILDNINSLIMAARSQGKQKLSVTKLLLFINEHYGLNLEQQGLEDLLGDNASIIEFNGDEIVIGEPENDDEEEASEDVHDMAVDQAADNMSMESVEFGSVLKLFEHDWTGTEISAKNVVLDESNEYYFLNNGAKKANSTYIITDIVPSKTLNESKFKCKIKGESFTLEIPVTAFKL